MEDSCLMISSSTLEKLFFLDNNCEETKKTLKDLPILGTSALEQFLEHTVQEQQRMRMSPDSTMELPQPLRPSASSDLPILQNCVVPDSTTSDLTYDSDAFNSEDSCSSFAEVTAASTDSLTTASTASITNANLLIAMSNEDESSSSSSSFDLKRPSMIFKKKNAKKAKKAGDSVLKCDLCNYTTRFKEHLTSHMNTHATIRNHMCSECGQTFKWSHSLKRHQRTHAPTSDFRYTCNFCFKTFSRKDHLSIHESLHTTSGMAFPCSDCGATFKNKKTLTGHMKTHTAEKAFKCNQCESEFTRKASLNRHVRAAHAGQVIPCPMCPAVFSYRSTLEDHKKAAHNEGRREYGCNLCGVQFAVKAYLSKHMVTCRNRAVGRSFACTLCSKSFPTKRHLHEHNKRKHPASTLNIIADDIPTSPTDNLKTDNFNAGTQFNTFDNFYYPTDNYDGSNKSHHPAVMGHDLPLPQINNSNVVVVGMEEEEEEDHNNVGSLLRLVYSCPDQLEGQDYHHQHQQLAGNLSSNSVASSDGGRQVCPENNLMADYTPILDGISLDYL